MSRTHRNHPIGKQEAKDFSDIMENQRGLALSLQKIPFNFRTDKCSRFVSKEYPNFNEVWGADRKRHHKKMSARKIRREGKKETQIWENLGEKMTCCIFKKDKFDQDEFWNLLEKVKDIRRSSHLDHTIYKCKNCGAFWLYEFYEYVDWNGGHDEIFETWAEIEESEVENTNCSHIRLRDNIFIRGPQDKKIKRK